MTTPASVRASRLAGDVNGDGYDDVLIAAPLFSAPELNEGRVWRFDGGPTGLPAGSSWYSESDQAGCQYGYSLAGAGDVNADGFGRRADRCALLQQRVRGRRSSLAIPWWDHESDLERLVPGTGIRPARVTELLSPVSGT